MRLMIGCGLESCHDATLQCTHVRDGYHSRFIHIHREFCRQVQERHAHGAGNAHGQQQREKKHSYRLHDGLIASESTNRVVEHEI